MLDKVAMEVRELLHGGDVLVFVTRPRPLNTVVQVVRNGVPLTHPGPNGPVTGYGLSARFDFEQCRAYAEIVATLCGLSVRSVEEKKEGENETVRVRVVAG